MADSLVAPEARAMVGKVVGSRTSVVSLKEAQRFAAAVNDLNPIYFDDAAARAAGYRGVVVPPMFISHATQGVTRLDGVNPDGLAAGVEGRNDVPLNVHRRMAGGEEVEFLAPVYPGDTITAETRIASIEEKEGRSGPFVIVVRESECRNQDGELVAIVRNSAISR